MKKYYDKNEKEVIVGSVIKTSSTVNGYDTFIITNSEPLEIHYCTIDSEFSIITIGAKYQYDCDSLLDKCPFSGETGYEIFDAKDYSYVANGLQPLRRKSDIGLKSMSIPNDEKESEIDISKLPSDGLGFKVIELDKNPKPYIVKLDGDKALEFILTKLYEQECIEINGVNQHKNGLNYNEWLNKNKLVKKL